MGKGDKGTRRGKIWRGSYGKTRRRKERKEQPVAPTPARPPRPAGR
ncbi:MAG: hypothetical protein OHK0015_40010 [Chloroflexi bacterium OHK40]